jgi:hypothetical protein
MSEFMEANDTLPMAHRGMPQGEHLLGAYRGSLRRSEPKIHNSLFRLPQGSAEFVDR